MSSQYFNIKLISNHNCSLSYLKVINLVSCEQKSSGSIEIESVLIESDDVRFGEDVTLTRRKVRDDVIEPDGFESEPRDITSSLDLKVENSDFGFESGSEVFGDGHVDDEHPAERSVVRGRCGQRRRRRRVAFLRIRKFDRTRTQNDLFAQHFISN
jgi:hypothetical protein